MANNSQFNGIQPARPPVIGLPPQNPLPSMPMQFRSTVPPPLAQSYIPVASQQFQPVGHMNIGGPAHPQQLQFPQPLPQLPARPGQGGPSLPPSQVISAQEIQPNRPVVSVTPHPQQNVQISNNFMPGLGALRVPFPSSYPLPMTSSGQVQINADASTCQPISQTNGPNFPTDGQFWQSTQSQSIQPVPDVSQSGDQIAVTTIGPATNAIPCSSDWPSSDWIVHDGRGGKRYYYNRRTGLSTWEKPLELMTEVERADATTDWREYTSPDGRKYYYNRVTKQSKWLIPDELKLAREQVKMESFTTTHIEKDINSHIPAAVPASGAQLSPADVDNSSSLAHGLVSSPSPVAPVVDVANPHPVMISGSSAVPVEPSPETANARGMHTPLGTVASTAAASGTGGTPGNVLTPTSDSGITSARDGSASLNGVSPGDTEESRKDIGVSGKANFTVLEERTLDREPLVYENKLDAKNAFKELLETSNVCSDWTWDQAMRVIINDRRYAALKSLGERKHAFNEFVGQKKKQEAEERRTKQKKARDDFRRMLEESKELTTSMKWSKAITIFEDDERFKAVERSKDREDLFEDFMIELGKKERLKAMEERKRNRMEYIEFLKSCDFIKSSSQWRKVQDRLEADERCSRLEKFDRLEFFQEYIHDLETEEEEQRKLRMEELRKTERKNRDEFRKLIEEHVTTGTLTVRTHWRDYCLKVKDSPAYLAVSSNTSGSTAKDLFEDVVEELDKQYLEDKTRIKDAVKLAKVSLSSTWTFEDFKTEISKDIKSPPISDINLKLVFDELLERVWEKEEKEAKRRKRLADDFYELLCSSKEITASSKWEDCEHLLEDRQGNWSGMEESFCMEIFEKYIVELKEKTKEERKRREEKAKKDRERKDRDSKKTKDRREKERGLESKKGKRKTKKDETDSDNADKTESYSFEENKSSGRDKDAKHRKRHISLEDTDLDEFEKTRSKSSHRHRDDHKKSKQMEQHAYNSEVDSESRYKKHKRDHRNGSHRNGDYDRHKGREFGEDGEVW